jgi:hypothetical protein
LIIQIKCYCVINIDVPQIYHLTSEQTFSVTVKNVKSIQVSGTIVSTSHSSWQLLLEMLTVAYSK